MRKFVFAIVLGCSSCAFAAEISPASALEQVEKAFQVHLSAKDKAIIDELVINLGSYSVIKAGIYNSYFKDLGRKTRGISTIDFLGYIFQDKNLIKHTRWILQSKRKWAGFSKGLKRGLAKGAEDGSLFQILPSFAKHCKADEDTLRYLADEGKWNDFLKHLLKKR